MCWKKQFKSTCDSHSTFAFIMLMSLSWCCSSFASYDDTAFILCKPHPNASSKCLIQTTARLLVYCGNHFSKFPSYSSSIYIFVFFFNSDLKVLYACVLLYARSCVCVCENTLLCVSVCKYWFKNNINHTLTKKFKKKNKMPYFSIEC